MKVNILATLTLAASTFTTSVYAQNYLLTIDITDPTAVVFTATGNFASTDDSMTSANDGIELLQFFNNGIELAIDNFGGTLAGGGSGEPYDTWYTDVPGGDSRNMRLLTGINNGNNTQNFTTISEAFTGNATTDFSDPDVIGFLPANGSSGDIMAGNTLNPGSVIGQWTVVINATPTPEPSTLALTSIGCIGAFFLARCRK